MFAKHCRSLPLELAVGLSRLADPTSYVLRMKFRIDNAKSNLSPVNVVLTAFLHPLQRLCLRSGQARFISGWDIFLAKTPGVGQQPQLVDELRDINWI
ncbi:MAG: hypothetical protein RJA99_987 [Pseudomonadota bacterium]